jgi:hypothetical protein
MAAIDPYRFTAVVILPLVSWAVVGLATWLLLRVVRP